MELQYSTYSLNNKYSKYYYLEYLLFQISIQIIFRFELEMVKGN